MPTHSDDVYYKIRVPQPGFDNFFSICCLQDFDEYDYDRTQWLQDDDGVVSFNSGDEARKYLSEEVDSRWIKPEDRYFSTHVSDYRS